MTTDRISAEPIIEQIPTPFRVRKVTSGYNGRDSYIVVLLRKGKPASRVSVHAFATRQSAQSNADELNTSALVLPHAEDPRPYAVRLAEAKARFAATNAVVAS